MIQTKAQIAYDLIPLVRHLNNGGVLQIDGRGGRIQLTEALYHDTFPEDKAPTSFPDSMFPFYWSTTINGVEFFAITERGDF